MNILQQKWSKSALMGLGILGMASSSQAAVIISFEQVGADVRVSASGTLAVDPTVLTASRANNSSFRGIGGGSLFNAASGNFINSGAGSLSANNLLLTGGNGTSGSTFGISNSDLFWDINDITGGSVGAVSELTWDPSKDFFVQTATTLAAMNADSFSNTLAWTATTTGDTISFTTVSPVPEPSSAILLGLGALGVVARRKRTS